ncbi:MAG: sigma-54-dependent Fis family transcriptional regulator [Planctomycetales bacterium]|nr:sigma-54-dependent Fis family transcriptional regulator [Planctomycetales bacterium]
MELSVNFQRVRTHDQAVALLLDLLANSESFETLSDYYAQLLTSACKVVGADNATILRADLGSWKQIAATYADHQPPTNLLADVLDSEQPHAFGKWAAAPLLKRSSDNELLAMEFPIAGSSDRLHLLDAVAAAVGVALHRFRRGQSLARKVRRLEAILEIAGQWNQNQEMESLLQQMAETSTTLLRAERASIFLWDRQNKILVGRPALGVDDNELRIPDDTGIVGQVVHSGDLRRVDEGSGDEDISRDVDDQTGFSTRNLLCVPLRDRKNAILGAFEMINKIDGNFTKEDEAGLVELAGHAAIALENTQQLQSLLDSKKQLAQQAAGEVQLIGESPPMQKLRNTVERVANTDLAILVLGENGTGKEVVSQMLHYLSVRRDEPFVAVNCAAMTETLLESELFGHEKGAFTDAHEARAGKFELASGGTLFLDEIGDLSLSGQAKLLRVLEEKVVVRVGGSIPISTDTRVVAATNQDLATMVQERRFREDLFYRLNVVSIHMPPLRERVDDIVLLAEHFLTGFCKRARRAVPRFTPEAIKRLRQHNWPGNVRELRNLMERLAYLSQSDIVEADDLAFIMSNKADAAGNISLDLSLTEATKQFQIEYIRKHIEVCGGNMSDAAKKLGLHRSNLYRKMRQLDMAGAEDEESG